MTNILRSNSLITLYNSTNVNELSSVFFVHPGWVADIIGVGFKNELVSLPDETITYQLACLHTIIPKPGTNMIYDNGVGAVLVTPDKYDDILVDQPMIVDCCGYNVSARDTHLYLTWPGHFRFVLNDPQAIGIVQIYMLAYPKNQFGEIGG
jgi:hypothetical protein